MAKVNFYEIKDVSINDLLLDTQNPRLNEQPDEKACIQAILNGRESQILNLARDIADKGLYPEVIIVSKHPDIPNKWRVRDGNRRITAIKLLHDPSRSTTAIRPKLEEITKTLTNYPLELNVLTCDDENAILRFLHLKHTGINEGVGQVEWDAFTKAIYSEKTNSPNSNIKAINLLRWAKESGGIDFDDSFPISTLSDRLMSKERLLQIGFELDGDKPLLVKEPISTLNKVRQIITDLKSGIHTSRSLDSAADIKRYVDGLCEKYGDGLPPPDMPTDGNKGGANPGASSGGEGNASGAGTNGGNQPPVTPPAPQPTPNPEPPSKPVPQNPQDRPKLFKKIGYISRFQKIKSKRQKF